MRNVHPTHLPVKKRGYSIVIPAAGKGTRLSSTIPKPLITIGGQTLFDRQVDYINRVFSKYEILLVGGFQFDKLKENITLSRRMKLLENEQFEETNVVKSIGIGVENARYDNIVVLYGDLVFNAYMLKLPLDTDSLVITARTMGKEEVGCTVANKRVTQLFYGLDTKWAQIAYFTGKEQESFREFCTDERNSKSFGFEAINYVINQGGFMKHYSPNRGKVIDIDSPKDLKTVGSILR